MNTLDTVFIIITAVCISLFFLIGTIVAIYAWVALRQIIKRAEVALDTVEEAGQFIAKVGRSGGFSALFKVIGQLYKLSRKINK